MAVYLVTWDLNREKPHYNQARAAFIALLDEFENYKDPALDSVRFISTNWDANEISEHLREAQDDNDTLFVTRLGTTDAARSGWLTEGVWDWIIGRE